MALPKHLLLVVLCLHLLIGLIVLVVVHWQFLWFLEEVAQAVYGTGLRAEFWTLIAIAIVSRSWAIFHQMVWSEIVEVKAL